MPSINELISRLEKLKNSTSEIAASVATELDPKLKEIIVKSINNFEADRPQNAMYTPTGNIRNISGEITSEGSSIYARVHNDGMSGYSGFDWGSPLDKDTAYEFMFHGGEHGHGRFQRGVTSPSPFDFVKNEIDKDFQSYMNKAVANAFKQVGF